MGRLASRQLVRTWRVIALLRCCGGVSLDKLARECGVTTRTIRRDLEALQDAGIPVTRVSPDDVFGSPWRLVGGSPCPLCGRGIATGKEYREARAS
jgi:predicted DNA-binding transcriptional regulator YafY